MSKTESTNPAESEARSTEEGVRDRNVLNKLLYRHLPDLLSLHRECRWIMSRIKQRSGGEGANRGESRLTSFVVVVEKLIKKLQSLHDVEWDPSKEPALQTLEANIVNTVLPVRDKLHQQWKQRTPTLNIATSSTSSVSSTSLSSSTKTSNEESLSNTGTSTVSSKRSQEMNGNAAFCPPAAVSVSKQNKAAKASKTKSNKDDTSIYTAHKPALREGAGPGPAIFLAGASSSAISRKLLRAGVPHSDTVGNNCNNFPSFSIIKGIVVDKPWYELVKRESKNNLQSKNTDAYPLNENLDDISVHSDCTGEDNWGLQFSGSGSTDIDFNADNLLESWGIFDTSFDKSIVPNEDQGEDKSIPSDIAIIPADGDTTDATTVANKKRKIADSGTTNSTANNTTIASFNSMTRSTEIIDTLTLPQQQLLRTIVPIPRNARTAEYTCSVCNIPYTTTVSSNPWWALYTHKCSHCQQVQIPRIDISTWINSVELDPYHAALYGEGVAEDPVV